VTSPVSLTVNGRPATVDVRADELLCDALRDRLGLTGTHVPCREGVCGSCNVVVNGELVRSCLMLAMQAEGADVRTVEGLAHGSALSDLQEAFVRSGAVQCGYCTSGILMTATDLLDRDGEADDEQILEALSGNICRCTGYGQIVDAIRSVAGREGDRP
jgi:carbon-monoxide dehydrogenase small subunit